MSLVFGSPSRCVLNRAGLIPGRCTWFSMVAPFVTSVHAFRVGTERSGLRVLHGMIPKTVAPFVILASVFAPLSARFHWAFTNVYND